MRMTEFRSTQPLSEDDLAAIRGNVMATIQARGKRRGLAVFLRLAVAAVAVVAIGVVFFARRKETATRVTSRPAIDAPARTASASRSTSAATTAATTSTATSGVVPASGAPATSPVSRSHTSIETARARLPRATDHAGQPSARAVHRQKHQPPQNPEVQTIRLEFRTPDPDVRIIWIANQNTQNTTTGGNS